jgi:hypothetical protein
MLHLVKLAVGATDVPDLRLWQAEQVRTDPPLRHLTRNLPRRAAEIVGEGSLYWVVAGALAARQRIRDIRADRRPDGTACAALVLDPQLVAVQARRMKPFQGWRYLAEADAPPDLDIGRDRHGTVLPPHLARELRTLCLI